MSLTRSNIAYNLEISPHKANVMYENQEVCYVFSSDLYKRKFFERIKENRETLTETLSKRLGFNFYNETLFDVKLYSSIEKRGFLLIVDGEKIQCQNNIIFVGDKMMRKNSNEL